MLLTLLEVATNCPHLTQLCLADNAIGSLKPVHLINEQLRKNAQLPNAKQAASQKQELRVLRSHASAGSLREREWLSAQNSKTQASFQSTLDQVRRRERSLQKLRAQRTEEDLGFRE